MNDLGLLHLFLGTQVLQMDDGILISQPKYELDLLKIFKIDNGKPCKTLFQLGIKVTKECDSIKLDGTLYMKLVGSLICLTHSWPDISFVVSLVSKFMHDPKEIHLTEFNRIVDYVKGTYHLGIKYCTNKSLILIKYIGSN